MRIAIVGGALLIVGAFAVVFGVLPLPALAALGERVWPILLFIVAITVVTELAAAAGLFTVIAEQLARWGLRRAWLLWLLVVALATVSTIFLSLDTTAVLLTPVVVTLARNVGLPTVPFALTTVWLANSASLLLPVSNLTNLLAANRLVGFSPARFAALMAAPAAVAVVVPSVLVFLLYRRALLSSYEPPARIAPEDRVLLWAAAVVVVVVLPLLVSGLPIWIPAAGGALVLGAFFVVRRPAAVRFALLPWPLVVFACGLFLVVAAASSLGLESFLRGAAGAGDGFIPLLRLAGTGVLSANAVGNLPAYLALEATTGSPARIAALLIGVNAGPLITPWASLATLLWAGRLAGLDARIPWRHFMLLGLVVVPITVVPAVAALFFVG